MTYVEVVEDGTILTADAGKIQNSSTSSVTGQTWQWHSLCRCDSNQEKKKNEKCSDKSLIL